MELLSCNDGGEVMRLVYTLQSSLTIVIRGLRRGEERREAHRGGPGWTGVQGPPTLCPSRTAGASLFRMWVEEKPCRSEWRKDYLVLSLSLDILLWRLGREG